MGNDSQNALFRPDGRILGKMAHNIREIKKIIVSEEKDGAFAVVDIDTLWVEKKSGGHNHWKGRVCKVYAKVGNEWKMTMHTGVLEY